MIMNRSYEGLEYSQHIGKPPFTYRPDLIAGRTGEDVDKTKPFEIISRRFQISRESAKYFLIRVQKSFKTEKPPHQLILEFMEDQNFESLPGPHEVAKLMNASGIWDQPLNREPHTLADEEDIHGE